MDLDADEQQFPLVLARNVRKFEVDCWDTNKLDWVTEWDDTNSIPPLVRVKLVLGGNTAAGASAPDFSVARVYSLPSQTMPAAVQNGALGCADHPLNENFPALISSRFRRHHRAGRGGGAVHSGGRAGDVHEGGKPARAKRE
jgi:hypothetical protein